MSAQQCRAWVGLPLRWSISLLTLYVCFSCRVGSTLFLRAQRFLCQLPYLACAVHVCPQSSCGVGSFRFLPKSGDVFVDEVPSYPPPHSTVCAGRDWVLLSTCASCRKSFQRVLCCIPVCVTPSFVSCSIARVYDTEEPFCFPPSSATATHRVTHHWKVSMRIVLVY